MHRRSVMWLLCCVSLATAGAVDSVSTVFFREYRFLLGHPEEMEVIANTGVTLNRVMSDLYFKGFGPRLPAKVGKFTEVAWSVFWTFSACLAMPGCWSRQGGRNGDIWWGETVKNPRC